MLELTVNAGEICPFKESTQLSDLNSSFLVSIQTLVSEFSLSIKLLFLKLSTKNPDLNLSIPSASLICNVLVSNSKSVKEVKSSRFSILFLIFQYLS